MRKAHDQKKAPNGKQGAHILGMGAQRKGKGATPGNLIAKFIAVKNPHLAQPIKHAHVEYLTNNEQDSPEPQSPYASTRGPERTMAIHVAPADKHRNLNNFKAIEELLDDLDRRANPRDARMGAQGATD